jgi:hypothetical protein
MKNTGDSILPCVLLFGAVSSESKSNLMIQVVNELDHIHGGKGHFSVSYLECITIEAFVWLLYLEAEMSWILSLLPTILVLMGHEVV